MSRNELPVAIIGAGPIGLAAAAHLLEQGREPLVLEAGSGVGHHVQDWAHVRMFSPWEFNIDEAARRLLEREGWRAPDPGQYPTGRELIEDYLWPLAVSPPLAQRIRTQHRVVAITRRDMDRMKDADREESPFLLQVDTPDAGRKEIVASAVIDASGTWRNPNPIGSHGLPVPGEVELAKHIRYGIPDVAGREAEHYAGQKVLVLGSGTSAFNVLEGLVALQSHAPETRVHWAVRRPSVEAVFRGGQNDPLEERASLAARARNLIDQGQVEFSGNVRVHRLEQTKEGIVAWSGDQPLAPVDTIIASTGFRPDFEMLPEIRLLLDPATQAPSRLAPHIDPNAHDCGSVPPHGVSELAQPEPDFYLAGMKSYGRAPNFLLVTGYEAVRSIAAELAGNHKAAREVRQVLPAGTEPCSLPAAQAQAPCCG